MCTWQAEITKTSDLKFLLKIEILADDKVKSIWNS